jgi:hypothetical protein
LSVAIETIGGIERAFGLDFLCRNEWIVEIPALPNAGDLILLARRVSVPGFSFNVEAREEGNHQVHYAMEESVDALDIEFDETVDGTVHAMIENWRNLMRGLSEGDSQFVLRARTPPAQYKRDILIKHLDRTLSVAHTLRAIGCFPKARMPYQLDYTDSAPVTLTLSLACDRVERSGGGASVASFSVQ